MIPDTITPATDPCDLARKWIISFDLAAGLIRMADRTPFQFQIISGWRSKDVQAELIRKGKGAPDHLSTHRSCPATGADLWPIIAVTNNVKAELGAAAVYSGLRWGGGSPIDPKTGIPEDWNHFDLGPRAQ